MHKTQRKPSNPPARVFKKLCEKKKYINRQLSLLLRERFIEHVYAERSQFGKDAKKLEEYLKALNSEKLVREFLDHKDLKNEKGAFRLIQSYIENPGMILDIIAKRDKKQIKADKEDKAEAIRKTRQSFARQLEAIALYNSYDPQY